MPRRSPIALPAILALAAVALLALLAAGLWWFSPRLPADVVTAPIRYEGIIEGKTRPVFRHFPGPRIREQVADMRLYHAPGFLRRPEILEVRFIADPGALTTLARDASKRRRLIEHEHSAAALDAQASRIITRLHTLGHPQLGDIDPNAYESIIVSHPAHDQWGGVVLNHMTGEVVFWAIDN